jgi:hypothetical protein
MLNSEQDLPVGGDHLYLKLLLFPQPGHRSHVESIQHLILLNSEQYLPIGGDYLHLWLLLFPLPFQSHYSQIKNTECFEHAQ